MLNNNSINNKIKKGAVIINSTKLENFKTVTKKCSLKGLVNLKTRTINKIKSYKGILMGASNLSSDDILMTLAKLEALYANSTVIKQLMAIANAGTAESEKITGINGSIYQLGDIKEQNALILNLIKKYESFNSEDYKNMVKSLKEDISKNKEIHKYHDNYRKEYNKTIEVEIKLYIV